MKSQQRNPVHDQSRDLHEAMLETLTLAIIPALSGTARDQASIARKTPIVKVASVSSGFPQDLASFTRLLIITDQTPHLAFIAARLARGESLQSIYLDWLQPAARLLGSWWEADDCSFIDVTLGVGRLQQLLRRYSAQFMQDGPRSEGPCQRRRALIIPAEGEQHTFGLSMVAEFFRRAGWELWGWPLLASDREQVALLHNKWLAVIGISAAADVNLIGLASRIKLFRTLSRNPEVKIMVGGHIFAAAPGLWSDVGADAYAADAAEAVLYAESLVLQA
jgi:methanogenic corrinoid protein MtbC1